MHKTKNFSVDAETRAFAEMVTEIRGSFKHSDAATNPGFVYAALIEGAYPASTSMKLVVHLPLFLATGKNSARNGSIAFTSDGKLVSFAIRYLFLR